MNPIRLSITALGLLAAAVPAVGQRLDPAQWRLAAEQPAASPGSTVLLRLTATMESGWHLYSPTTPPGGPIPTTIELSDNPAIESYNLFQQPPVTKFDPNFQLDTETYEREAVFLFQVASLTVYALFAFAGAGLTAAAVSTTSNFNRSGTCVLAHIG